MKIEKCKITKIEKISLNIVSLAFESLYFSEHLCPGQFINIKIDNDLPNLLRRPFSISNVDNREVYIFFNIVGKGTFSLSEKKVGDEIEILGPSGNGFNYDNGYEKHIIVAGGVGIAPFPFLFHELSKRKKSIDLYFGFRTKNEVIDFGISNINIATDDGSFGYKGNVNDLLFSKISDYDTKDTKIYACGPNAMLKNLSDKMSSLSYETEISIESYMACGVGLCQGCPVESKTTPGKYLLVCRDGPCFNIKDILL
jgi:dihydroorotate dehydrogenase electron transfer subunit